MLSQHEPLWYRQVTGEQWRAFFATFFGWLLDGFDFTIMTFILIDIQNSFTVDRALAGALGTVTCCSGWSVDSQPASRPIDGAGSCR